MATVTVPEFDDAFGNWLAGFIDGEGCFTIAPQPCGIRYYCRFHIRLRADDRPVLERIQRYLGVGNMYEYAPTPRALENLAGSKPNALLVIGSQAGAVRLAAVLDRYPLRAKKAGDYEIWRQALSARARHDWQLMAVLRQRLRSGRDYDLAEVETTEAEFLPTQMLLEVA